MTRLSLIGSSFTAAMRPIECMGRDPRVNRALTSIFAKVRQAATNQSPVATNLVEDIPDDLRPKFTPLIDVVKSCKAVKELQELKKALLACGMTTAFLGANKAISYPPIELISKMVQFVNHAQTSPNQWIKLAQEFKAHKGVEEATERAAKSAFNALTRAIGVAQDAPVVEEAVKVLKETGLDVLDEEDKKTLEGFIQSQTIPWNEIRKSLPLQEILPAKSPLTFKPSGSKQDVEAAGSWSFTNWIDRCINGASSAIKQQRVQQLLWVAGFFAFGVVLKSVAKGSEQAISLPVGEER